MSHSLTVHVSDAAYTSLADRARNSGTTAAEIAAEILEQQAVSRDRAGNPQARDRFERHFGAVDLGRATGVDNDSIDADLARSYAGNSEGE